MFSQYLKVVNHKKYPVRCVTLVWLQLESSLIG